MMQGFVNQSCEAVLPIEVDHATITPADRPCKDQKLNPHSRSGFPQRSIVQLIIGQMDRGGERVMS